MGTFTALVALVAGVGVIVSAVMLPLHWRAVGLPEARAELIRVRALLQNSEPLSSASAKAADQALADLVRDLRHTRVREAVRRVLADYRRTFASEPGPWVWVIGGPETDADRQHSKRVELHHQNRAAALAAIEEALRAIRNAERFIRFRPSGGSA